MISHQFGSPGDALVIVDVQTDFCPGGALPIDQGDTIVSKINVWLRQAEGLHVPVFASRDWHPREHLSFKSQGGLWPEHCIQDTLGAAFHPDLKLSPSTVLITKGVRFDQDQNSVFDATGLEAHLRRIGIQRLFVAGLALDVCVLATVLDARRAGLEVALIADATRPVDAESGAAALEQMRKVGVAMVEQTDAPAADGQNNDGEVCLKAPEWAEHQRFGDDDMGCDDGRGG